jgi:D-alanine-D-alanine ligase
MDKAAAKAAVAAAGVPVAAGGIWAVGAPPPEVQPPLVLKPQCGGSSVGLLILREGDSLPKTPPSTPLLYEQLLPGREFSVGVLEGKALPVVEICPLGGSYDYAHKYTPGATRELCPAPIGQMQEVRLRTLAEIAFHALGLRDYARVDFKEDGEGRPVFLEANTLPGMTETSLMPLAAAAVGISYGALCEKMARLAAARRP